MPCPNEQTLLLLADDELPPSERAEVERHLDECRACRSALERMRAQDALCRSALRSIPVTPPPARLAMPRRSRLARAILAAAAVLVLAGALAAIVQLAGRDEVNVATKSAEPATSTTATAPATQPDAEAARRMDEAFERWAAEHRKKRVPLIPMEEIATYEPPVIQPYRGI